MANYLFPTTYDLRIKGKTFGRATYMGSVGFGDGVGDTTSVMFDNDDAKTVEFPQSVFEEMFEQREDDYHIQTEHTGHCDWCDWSTSPGEDVKAVTATIREHVESVHADQIASMWGGRYNDMKENV